MALISAWQQVCQGIQERLPTTYSIVHCEEKHCPYNLFQEDVQRYVIIKGREGGIYRHYNVQS